LVVVLSAALLAAVVLFLERMEKPADEREPRKAMEPKTREPRAEAEPPESHPPGPPSEEREGRKLAIIIDDIGFDLKVVEELAAMKAPLAFAILPLTPHATEAAEHLHAAGKEVLLHLPMEPHSYPTHRPGQGALFTDMSDGAIRKQIVRNLASVPHVSGVNNHMGSRFMEDEARVAVVMEELAKSGLFFVDSRTTPKSRGREAAAKAGIRYASRAVFIDHTRGYNHALENLTHLPRTGPDSKGTKPLLLIGHPYPETVRALRDALSVWSDAGVQVIPVSAYLANTAGGENFASGRKP